MIQMNCESVSGRRLSRWVRRRAAGLGDRSLAPVFLLLWSFLNAVFACHLQLGATVPADDNLPLLCPLSQIEFTPANRTLRHNRTSLKFSNHLRARKNSFCGVEFNLAEG